MNAQPKRPTLRPITEQPIGFDLFRLPGLRRLLRWKYARVTLQLPLLILAVFVIVDGFTGRQLAPRNVATTSVWLHYRGLVVIALALFGNAFCAACPLMLTRGMSRWLEKHLPQKYAWPKALKNKYLIVALLGFYFFSYEYFDLWASPWLTAWLAVGYFAGALAVDTFFPSGTFCRYVCLLGNFNFAFASASPTQITALDHHVCRSCTHKPCLHGRYSSTHKPESLPLRTNGSKEVAFIPTSEIVRPGGTGYFPGCETDLFVPAIQSNMDCTLCFNCLRACPYDNVALTLRTPGWEWMKSPWLKRGRLAVMIMGVLLTFWGILNAAAMIGPFFGIAQRIAAGLHTESEALVLGLIFVAVAGIGLGITLAAASLADFIGGAQVRPWRAFQRWGYVVIALGFGFWGAHFLFHFLTGAVSVVPVFQHFFELRGLGVDPNWQLARLVPTRWLFPITAGITAVYGLLAFTLSVRIALRDFGQRGVVAMWPMLLFVLAFLVFALLILAQPMEMRGTILGPSF
ncbi:MAG: hypothetical protein JSV66_03260 [Trueperaceae bacterium]|nr:MAG: hypothetical protein JSV66_03260 [Trueperaceae bacterium]